MFAAAFPLFNITDEASHFLAIRMFAGGRLPGRELPPVDSEFANTYILYFSPEYTYSQDYLDLNGPRTALYRIAPQDRDRAYGQEFYAQKWRDWTQKANFEAQAPPAYYLLAAA